MLWCGCRLWFRLLRKPKLTENVQFGVQWVTLQRRSIHCICRPHRSAEMFRLHSASQLSVIDNCNVVRTPSINQWRPSVVGGHTSQMHSAISVIHRILSLRCATGMTAIVLSIPLFLSLHDFRSIPTRCSPHAVPSSNGFVSIWQCNDCVDVRTPLFGVSSKSSNEWRVAATCLDSLSYLKGQLTPKFKYSALHVYEL